MLHKLERIPVLWSLPRTAVGAEIGVLDGDFSARILRWAAPRKLWLIDPWAYQPDHSESLFGSERMSQGRMDARYEAVRQRFAPEIERGQVEIIRDFSDRASMLIPNGSLDFVYVDGLHTYEGVKSDLANYYPKLKSGGLIFGDDYRSDCWWGDGVVRAFDELIAEKALRVRFKIGSQIAVRIR